MADTKVAEPKSYAGIIKIIIIVVLGLLLTGLVLFLVLWVFRKVASNGVKQDYLGILDVRSSSFASGVSLVEMSSLKTENITQLTYTIGVNMYNLYNSTTGKVLFARGDTSDGRSQDFAIYIDKQYNDLLLAFNTNNTSGTSIGDKYCIFRVENVPIYRWTVFHLVYDIGLRTAKFYVDGDLRKVCNLFACSQGVRNHASKKFSAGKILNSSENFAEPDPKFANYGALYVRTRAMDPPEIAAEASLLLDRLSALQEEANRTGNNNSCTISQ